MRKMDKFHLGMHVGEIKAWCEAAKNEAKIMSLSAPFKPEEYNEILPYMVEYSERNGVNYYLEKSIIQTDLFRDMDLSGIWVFIIYKNDETLVKYLKLKEEKKVLVSEGIYQEEKRKQVAKKFGVLLGYSKGAIAEKLD